MGLLFVCAAVVRIGPTGMAAPSTLRRTLEIERSWSRIEHAVGRRGGQTNRPASLSAAAPLALVESLKRRQRDTWDPPYRTRSTTEKSGRR